MESRAASVLPVRAWQVWRDRGTQYAWHKVLRRSLSPWPEWKRRWLYANPRQYWTLRGGDDYFREQEGQTLRTQRSEWLAARIASYQPASILEIGCGYGKQILALKRHLDIPITGVDFSPSQLRRGHEYLQGVSRVTLIEASGDSLPFGDNTFDLVLTSAVILHNPPEIADRIRSEVVRVARRFAAHNEDTDVSYNRYGYDTAAWYRSRGIRLAEAGPIPNLPDSDLSQFCVAEL